MANAPATNPSAHDTAAAKKYYDDYWAKHSSNLNAHELHRLGKIYNGIALLGHRPGNANLRICDFGCGSGWLSSELSKLGHVTGVDQSEEGVRLAAAKWPHIQFEVQDVCSWRPVEKFDLLVSSEVLEHVPDQSAFKATIDALLCRGGWALITTPNRRVKAAWDRGQMGNQLREDWLTPSELRHLFSPNYELIWHETFLFDFSYTGIFRFISAPKLRRIFNSLRLTSIYDGIRSSSGLGLYQILMARKTN